jgi:hypothetical protein
MTLLLDHPLADIFPLLEGEELNALTEDIRVNGQRVPITIYEDKILDGRNRYRACVKIGIGPRSVVFTGSRAEAEAFVISMNVHRRHLSEFQRAGLALKLATATRGGDRKSLNMAADQRAKWPFGEKPKTIAEAAKQVEVSETTIKRVARIQGGRPEFAEGVKLGLLTISRAATLAGQSPEEQDAEVERWLGKAIHFKSMSSERRFQRKPRKPVSAQRVSHLEAVVRAASHDERELVWRWLWDGFGPVAKGRLIEQVIAPHQHELFGVDGDA